MFVLEIMTIFSEIINILLGLEKTIMAIYTYVKKKLLERSKHDF